MRYRSHNTLQPGRAGFTLIEMLIAMALSIFIMGILSEAFVTGLNSFGNLKALADLEQRLRTVANIIRRDLRAPHFENSRRLSECTVTGRPMPVLDGLKAAAFNQQEALVLHSQLAQYLMKPPAQGFFSIEEWANRTSGATTFYEGKDSSERPSYRDQVAFDPAGNIIRSSDVLHFTSRLEGNDPANFFYGKVRLGTWQIGSSLPRPVDIIGGSYGSSRYDSYSVNNTTVPPTIVGNGLYTSQAAELLYFMGRDETTFLPGVGTADGPVLTFNLYRQAWLLVPDQYSNGGPAPVGVPSSTPIYDPVIANFFAENDLSAAPDVVIDKPPPIPAMFLNTMSDVQHRTRRRDFGLVRSPRIIPATGGLDGSDIMLTNVISFDVKVFDPFAYKIPIGSPSGGPASGRGAYVDIGDVIQTPAAGVNSRPTAAGLPGTGDYLQPVFGGPAIPPGPTPIIDFFDSGTDRLEGTPGGSNLGKTKPTHNYPFTSILITIRVWEPKSKQTRQISIIQDM